MSLVPRAAWRVVARRAVSDKAILAAVFVAVLLAITLMAAGPIYIEAVTLSSLRRTLADAPPTAANVVVTTRVEPGSVEETDELVVGSLSRAFARPGAEVYRRGTSDSYGFEGLAGDHESEITVFRWFTGVEEHADIEGSWPRVRNDRVEVAIPATMASHLDLGVGDRLQTVSRLDADQRVLVTVSGVYEVADANDPYWLEDGLDTTGTAESTSFTTLGPLVVDFSAFYAGIAPASSALRWSAFPDFDALDVGDMSTINARLGGLDATFNTGREVGNQIHIETDLPSVFRSTQRSLLVTRSAVLILTVQMAVLAIYALLLAANLLADSRDVETSTLRARGSSSGQLLVMSAMEGLLVTLPALALAPFLAAWFLRLFNDTGPLTTIGLEIEPSPVASSWFLAAVAAACCVVALMIPAYRAARRFGSVRADRARQEKGSLARRAGVDIALLAIAGLGFWQLAQYGTPLTQSVQGQLAVDPLLVAAPALALLAGAVLTLRALPLLARLGESVVARGRTLTLALGVWHLGRQPARFSRSALMLTLALAVGVFALAYDATWQKSQADQSGFINGADIQALPSQLPDSLPSSALPAAYEDVDGVDSLTPVLRASGEMIGATLPLEYVALDAASASEVVIFREDQAGVSIDELMSKLAAGRPEPIGIELPGRPDRIAVTTSLSIEPLDEVLAEVGDESSAGFVPYLRAVLLDGDGLPVRVEIGEIPETGLPVSMEADLVFTDSMGEKFLPTYPLRLTGFEIHSLAPFDPFQRSARWAVASVDVREGSSAWAPVEITADSSDVETAVSSLRVAAQFPEMTLVAPDEPGVTVRLLSGTTNAQTRQPVHHMIWLDAPPETESIPVVVSSQLAIDVNASVGDTVPLDGVPLYDGPATIVGMVDTFPTVDPNTTYAAILDYPTYMSAVFAAGVYPPDPDAFWFEAAEQTMSSTAELLRDDPFSSTAVVTRAEVAEDLAHDPVSIGTIGSLLMGLAAAMVLAAIGFLVNVVFTNRSRQAQFALMRAMGLSNRQLLRWVAIESGVVVGFALLAGVGLGVLLSGIALPLIAVTQEATNVVPPIEVVFPRGQIAVLVGLVALLLVVALLMSRHMLRRLQPAALLRAGDE